MDSLSVDVVTAEEDTGFVTVDEVIEDLRKNLVHFQERRK